jgi:ribosome biogenesis protein Nip4
MKEIEAFVKQFNARLALDKSRVVRNRNRYYMLNENLKQQIPKNFFHAGVYLGAVKGASFFPSFLLLSMIAEIKANKLVVDKKSAWLFICGRDIFKQGILNDTRLKKGDYALILNERNECLGFGKVMLNIRQEIDVKKVAVKNILDLGNFLRREKRQQRSGMSQNRYNKPRRPHRK